MLADGIIRSREIQQVLAATNHGGAVGKSPQQGGNANGSRKLPLLDDPNEARKLGDDVRAKVLIADLLSQLRVSPDPKSDSVTLEFVSETRKRTSISTIFRPPIEVFQAQCRAVTRWAEFRAERAPEILSQLGPQTAYFDAILDLTPSRKPATLEWYGVGMLFA